MTQEFQRWDAKSIRSFNPNMRYRTFGKTGEKVSVLGFGMMRLPVVNGDYGVIDYEKASSLVRYAVEHGVNYLDTSWPYHSTDMSQGGASEPFVGRVVKEIGRENVFIATKLPIWAVKSRADMDMFLNKQLERLQTDHVDFYLVHNIMGATWRNVVACGLSDFLDHALADGRIRFAGFSFHDTPDLYKEVLNYYDWSFMQHVCNYYDVNFEAGTKGILGAALRDMGCVAMEPIMGGMLANQLPPEAVEVLKAAAPERTPAQWAIRWVWNKPEIRVLLSGMNELEQVKENLAQASMADVPMSDEELAAIDKVREIINSKSDLGCRECGKCRCPKGVNLLQCFGTYNINHAFKVIPISHHNYALMIKGQSTAAAACDGCNLCAGQCPYGVDIPAALKKVADYFEKNDMGGW